MGRVLEYRADTGGHCVAVPAVFRLYFPYWIWRSAHGLGGLDHFFAPQAGSAERLKGIFDGEDRHDFFGAFC